MEQLDDLLAGAEVSLGDDEELASRLADILRSDSLESHRRYLFCLARTTSGNV